MRFLGIDYGTKRIGVSLSDDGGRLAFPHTTVSNDGGAIGEIKEIVSTYEIGCIVMGESRDYQMKDNRIMEEAKEFAEDLFEETKVEVVFHPEFMTSMQAEKTHFQLTKTPDRKIGKAQQAKQVDAQAAAIMLQSYLDTKN